MNMYEQEGTDPGANNISNFERSLFKDGSLDPASRIAHLASMHDSNTYSMMFRALMEQTADIDDWAHMDGLNGYNTAYYGQRFVDFWQRDYR